MDIDVEHGEDARIDALADGFRPTDAGNANRFVAVTDGQVRYVRKWDKFIVYRDGVWVVDGKDVLVTGWAKLVAQRMFQFATQPELGTTGRDSMLAWARRSESMERLNAMVKAARDVPGVLVEHDQLDRQHHLLNVLNGTVDLRDGRLLAHDPEHLITRQLAVAYDPTAECPEWERCLAEWQPDPAVRRYLQEKAGAAATGYAPEEFDVHLGDGGNGKGKFFGQLMHVLGPYAIVPHKSLLVAQKHEQHETVMAELHGVRLAVAAETDRGARLDEEKIKQLTGGDALRGRRMREDPWYFEPTHSLALHTNYRPRVRGTDDGIWRRINLIPWGRSFTANADPQLAAKLRTEAAGTLNWIVDGARRWLANQRRFTLPERVIAASSEYRAQADPLHRFLVGATVDGPDLFVTTESIYEAFLAWRTDETHDEAPPFVTKVALVQRLRKRYQPGRRVVSGRQVRGWCGLALRPEFVEFVDAVRRLQPDRLKPGLGDLATEGAERS